MFLQEQEKMACKMVFKPKAQTGGRKVCDEEELFFLDEAASTATARLHYLWIDCPIRGAGRCRALKQSCSHLLIDATIGRS